MSTATRRATATRQAGWLSGPLAALVAGLAFAACDVDDSSLPGELDAGGSVDGTVDAPTPGDGSSSDAAGDAADASSDTADASDALATDSADAADAVAVDAGDTMAPAFTGAASVVVVDATHLSVSWTPAIDDRRSASEPRLRSLLQRHAHCVHERVRGDGHVRRWRVVLQPRARANDARLDHRRRAQQLSELQSPSPASLGPEVHATMPETFAVSLSPHALPKRPMTP